MKRGIIIVIIIIILAGLGFGAYSMFLKPKPSAASTVPTATVQLGSLAATVNAAGNVQAHQAVGLSFLQAGTVQKVNVTVGQHVKAGDVLAELNTAALALQVTAAQVDLKTAQLTLAQTKAPATQEDIASARAQVAAAQANYDKLAAGASQADLTAAQAAVASAQAQYNAAVKTAGAANSQLQAALSAYEKTQVALAKAQGDYNLVASRPNIGALPQSVALQNATIDNDQAKAAYEALLATATSDSNSTIAQAKSGLQQAQANLAKLQNQVTQNDLTASQSLVIQAQSSLDKLLAGPDANAIAIAQNGVDAADIALKQAQLALQESEIVAPFDSVVTAVNITLGQNAGGVAIQLADLDHLEIVVNMAEVDVGQAKVGQACQITLDALPNATLDGVVSQIAPAGVLTQGVVNYPVTVSLTKPPATVKTGMSANVNVIVNQRTNVLIVPNRAVKSQGRNKVVTVLFEGNTITTNVQTGLTNDTSTEITSGLKEGDVVVLSGTTTAPVRTGGGDIIPIGRIGG